MRGIRRLSTRGVVKKEAAVDEQIKKMVDTCYLTTYQGLRDRALLLVGFAGALRRSELVALDVAHLKVADDGFIVTIAKSKTTITQESAICATNASAFLRVLGIFLSP